MIKTRNPGGNGRRTRNPNRAKFHGKPWNPRRNANYAQAFNVKRMGLDSKVSVYVDPSRIEPVSRPSWLDVNFR